jgi:peptidoglycan hydrolase CwlO-like protein
MMFFTTQRLKLPSYLFTFLAALLLGYSYIPSVSAQTITQDSAEGLRTRLSEVQTKQAELQARLAELDEQAKPENIELGLAGVGTTHPEVLREQRRRQLEAEKTRVRSQLDQLNASRTRLETAIAQADAASYQLKAGVTPAPTQALDTSNPASAPIPTSTTPSSRPGRKRKAKSRRHLKPIARNFVIPAILIEQV